MTGSSKTSNMNHLSGSGTVLVNKVVSKVSGDMECVSATQLSSYNGIEQPTTLEKKYLLQVMPSTSFRTGMYGF